MATEPVFWFSFTGPSGKEWRVFLSGRRHNSELGAGSDGGGASGLAYFDTCHIEIDVQDHDADWQDSTTLHEILHVAIQGANLSPRKEEAVVVRLEKALWPILKKYGLKWPRRPAAYRRVREGR